MSRELFVAKIPPNVSVDDLQALFNTIAPVESVKRPRDFETGELRSLERDLVRPRYERHDPGAQHPRLHE